MDRNQGDINPLTDHGETDFTDELIDFFEQKKNSKPCQNDAQNRIMNSQTLNSNKMEILPNPVQVIPPTAEQKELYEAHLTEKMTLPLYLKNQSLPPSN